MLDAYSQPLLIVGEFLISDGIVFDIIGLEYDKLFLNKLTFGLEI